eukprot:scaffold248311_cov60-Cyclotella_meneghiniana.AAC.1
MRGKGVNSSLSKAGFFFGVERRKMAIDVRATATKAITTEIELFSIILANRLVKMTLLSAGHQHQPAPEHHVN